MLSLNHNAKIRNRWGVNSQLLILAHVLSYFFIDSFRNVAIFLFISEKMISFAKYIIEFK